MGFPAYVFVLYLHYYYYNLVHQIISFWGRSCPVHQTYLCGSSPHRIQCIYFVHIVYAFTIGRYLSYGRADTYYIYNIKYIWRITIERKTSRFENFKRYLCLTFGIILCVSTAHFNNNWKRGWGGMSELVSEWLRDGAGW